MEFWNIKQHSRHNMKPFCYWIVSGKICNVRMMNLQKRSNKKSNEILCQCQNKIKQMEENQKYKKKVKLENKEEI